MPPTMVVLAAGGSSRFRRPKQLEPIGPDGATLLDYLLFDAAGCGIERAVLVTRPDLEERLLATVRRRFPCIRVSAIRQPSPREVPGVPPARTRPLGTGFAVLAAAPALAGPFVVANADDFYGRAAMSSIVSFLDGSSESAHAIGGFRLASTLSPHGGVSRAICVTDGNGRLRDLVEVLGVVETGDGARGRTSRGRARTLAGHELVSMNLWGFRPAILPFLADDFATFVTELDASRPDDGEFLLSEAVGSRVRRGEVAVQVLPAGGEWFGITFESDAATARRRAAALTADGTYPEKIACS